MEQNGKCCLLVRVSTDAQSYDEQERQLYDMAIKDGFTPENIIPICEKESGIKSTEEERKGLITLKEQIYKGGVKCVYAWTIDRIGRKKKVLFSILEYLTERGIQLIIKEPSLKLLKEDCKTIDEGAETVFTLYAQLAETEMRNKSVRLQRGRIEKAREGKFGGGKIRFGYKVGERKKMEIEETEAELIKEIYNLYASGKYSIMTLATELNERGYNVRGKRLTTIFVNRVLLSTSYQGGTESVTKDGQTIKRSYPQIVSKELADRCKTIASANFSGDITKQNKQISLGAKLIKCPYCGNYLVHSNRAYKCVTTKDKTRGKECKNKTSMDANWLDALLWNYARAKEIEVILKDTTEKRKEYESRIKVNEQKINANQKYINEKIEEKRKRINNLYLDAEITEEEYNRRKERINNEKKDITEQITRLKEENNRMLSYISTESREERFFNIHRLTYNMVQTTDRKKLYEIVRNHVLNVSIVSRIWNGKKQHQIIIQGTDGTTDNYLYMAKSKVRNEYGQILKLFHLDGEDKAEPLYISKQTELTEESQLIDYTFSQFGGKERQKGEIEIISTEEH